MVTNMEMESLLEEKRDMENFTVLLNEVLRETDDESLKEEVKSNLREISQAYRFFVVGAEKTGRTAFLRRCFLENRKELLAMGETEGILELRYGVREAVIPVENGYNRRFVPDSALEGIALIDVGGREFYQRERAAELAKSVDVILAIFSAENIQDEYTWDFIEKNALKKRVVCILTKADLYPDEIVEKKRNKLLDYMEELQLSVPVFAVSDKEEDLDAYEKIKSYISKNIIGIDPAEKKKKDNFYMLIKIYGKLKNSVEKRNRQYEEDKRILAIMDKRIKEFYDSQEGEIKKLKDVIVRTIREEIDNYQRSILRQFEPGELKRNPNTQKKKVFMDWLQHEVNRYETILNNRISEQTNKVMRHYITDIDDVCSKLQECMEEREAFLEECDFFYGSLAKSKSAMVRNTMQVVSENHKDYQTLMQASGELFDKIWEERRKRDRKVAVTTAASTVVTATAGAAGAVTVANLLAGGGAAAAGGIAAAPVLATVMAALILGSVGYEAGKKLGEMYFDGKLEKNTEKYIGEFKESIKQTRELMENKTLEKLEELFQNEFTTLDRNLLQFRATTNIDAQKVPLLESKVQELESLIERLKNFSNVELEAGGNYL